MGLSLLNVNPVVCSIVILLKKSKNLLASHTPMTYTKLYLKRMDQPSGSVGAPNLSLLANAEKLKAALITVSLLINLLCILEILLATIIWIACKH